MKCGHHRHFLYFPKRNCGLSSTTSLAIRSSPIWFLEVRISETVANLYNNDYLSRQREMSPGITLTAGTDKDKGLWPYCRLRSRALVVNHALVRFTGFNAGNNDMGIVDVGNYSVIDTFPYWWFISVTSIGPLVLCRRIALDVPDTRQKPSSASTMCYY